MANSLVQEPYRPDWVDRRAASLSTMFDNGVASADVGGGADAHVHDFDGMTVASAARRLGRIFAGNDLRAFATRTDAAGLFGGPRIRFVGEEKGLGPPMKDLPIKSDQPEPVPQPSVPATQPPVTTPAAPPVTVPDPPPASAQPAPTTPAQAPPPALPPATPPGADPFGLPDTTGKVEGSEWDTVLPDGRIVHNRIPFGNGTNSVDQTIPDGKGGFTQSRVAAGENGGWQRWNLNADGTAFYGNKASSESGMVGQDYGRSTPTTGVPDQVLVHTPDYKGIQNPSYDENGTLVGVDVAVPNELGLYDNYHYDLYNNLTVSRATPDGRGGISSAFVAQFDSNGEGWEIDRLGNRWDVGKDLLGRRTKGRTEQTDKGTHVYFVDHNGVLFDSFYGSGGNSSYTDVYNSDQTITRRFRDGTEVRFDRYLEVQDYKGPPDRRDFVEKGVDAIVGVGGGLKSWASDFVQVFDYGSGLRAAVDPMNPAARAAAAEQFERSSSAYAGASNFIIDSAVYPVVTVADWYRYTVGGAMYGLGGDPISPAGRARLQASQEYMNRAPGAVETVLAATTFLVPEFGAPARAGVAVARGAAAEAAGAVGNRALRSGVTALGSETVPIGSRWLTIADLPLDSSSSFGVRALESSTSRGATSMPPSGIIKFDTMRSGTRAMTTADVPMRGSVPFGARAFESDLFRGTSLAGRRSADLPDNLFARSSERAAVAAGGGAERQLAAVGSGGVVTRAETELAAVVEARSARVVNSTPPGASTTRSATSTGSGGASSGSGARGGTGGSGGTPPPSGSGGASSRSRDPRRLLIGYQAPKAMAQPAENLSQAAFVNLYKPRPGRPPLKSDTHYVHTDKFGRKTTIVTGADGAPIYIETWGSRSRTGTTSGRITYNPLLRDPLPNVVYRVNKQFLVRTDTFARPVEGYHAGLEIVAKADRTRSLSQQRSFNAKNRRSGVISGRSVDAGHTFRDMYGSPAEHLFYTPQRSAVNQGGGDFYAMEEEIRLLLEAAASGTRTGRVEFSILKSYDKTPAALGRAVGDELVPLRYDVLFREVGTRQWETRRISNV